MQIRRRAKRNVGRHRVHLHGILIERLVIAGIQMVLDLVKHKIRARDVASSDQRANRKKARIVPKGQHDAHGATHLLGPEAHGVDGTCGNSPHALKVGDTLLAKHVKNSSGKNASITAAF